ncbi:accessory Sec system protein Asp3 [Streptococcus cuniculi]|uniref:Accessory Sec system protein Asp3 n=1 Tax=Streptococcus cuniculi TaxID=1432788 RepID=A0A4Y9JBW6_9STRE|nr:accessory Sec system protein Asp3 [Streptococcus cuniculi]MBF0778470.1 accessory Sec system protein Asp3 [Streptococcus cuniculi]TFU97566.1 accessory Sec system protein Asp3 [Streptococcus cuniculi]
MTKHLLTTIRWREVYSGSAYLYGSLVDFSEDNVTFYNPRLASGKPIVRFTSRTNYQGERRSPNLPLLIAHHRYRLERQIVSEPADRVFIQIDYYNRQNEKISFEILRKGKEVFTCPAGVAFYTITVLSAGCQRVHFEEMRLYHEGELKEVAVARPLAKRYTENQLPEELNLIKPFIQLL